MRIHTNATEEQVREAVQSAGVSLHNGLPTHGSRTHPRAFQLRLEGNGGRNNTGVYGAGDYHGATWDEWGAVLSGIFRADPKARMGGTEKHPKYADAEHFHIITGGRFEESGLPADTHPRHRWSMTSPREFECVHKAGCSAIWRPGWYR